MTDKRVEIYSLPNSRIDMRSSKNAGTLDRNSELEMWTRWPHQGQARQGHRRKEVGQPDRVHGSPRSLTPAGPARPGWADGAGFSLSSSGNAVVVVGECFVLLAGLEAAVEDADPAVRRWLDEVAQVVGRGRMGAQWRCHLLLTTQVSADTFFCMQGMAIRGELNATFFAGVGP